MLGPATLALAMLCLPAPAARAQTPGWDWRNGFGPPRGAAAATPAPLPLDAAPPPLARLALIDTGEGLEAWVDNALDGPVEVLLRATDGGTPRADPPLPTRALVPALERRLVARITAGSALRLHLDAVPGSPNARPRDVEYLYPLGAAPLRISQGWGGWHSHRADEHRYAVDFAAPAGTPVLAARAGIVMQTVDDVRSSAAGDGDASEDTDSASRANVVRILHEDGTMALYAHLQTGGVRVRPGQRVRRGEIIGLSGDSGFSSGPHLHFAVHANRGLRLHALPFRMFGPDGLLRFEEAPAAP